MSYAGGFVSWGTGQATFGGAAVFAALNGKNILQSASLTRDFTLKEILDEVGNAKVLKATNKQFNLNLGIIPNDATSEANADGLLVLPAALDQVTWAGCKITQMNGVWLVVGGLSIDLAQGGENMIKMQIRRYEQNSLPAQS